MQTLCSGSISASGEKKNIRLRLGYNIILHSTDVMSSFLAGIFFPLFYWWIQKTLFSLSLGTNTTGYCWQCKCKQSTSYILTIYSMLFQKKFTTCMIIAIFCITGIQTVPCSKSSIKVKKLSEGATFRFCKNCIANLKRFVHTESFNVAGGKLTQFCIDIYQTNKNRNDHAHSFSVKFFFFFNLKSSYIES